MTSIPGTSLPTAPRKTAKRAQSNRSNTNRGKLVPVRVETFGQCAVDVGGIRLGRNADVVIAVLVFLSCAPQARVSREAIMERLWPGSPATRQRGNLRQALYKLRQMGLNVEMSGDLVALDPRHFEPTFSVRRDVQSFDQQVVRGRESIGMFLQGFDTSAGIAIEDWVENERERAHGDARRVLAQTLSARHAVADWAGAEPLARWLLQFDPLNELATLVSAECLMLAGAKYEAIRLLDRYMKELGPGAEDLRFPAATLRKRIAAPAPQRISFAPTERHFMGREGVMSDLQICLRRAKHRDGSATLLHGSAGMGKTRVLSELTKVAQLEGVRDVRVSCRESDITRPLSIFLDMVPDLLQMSGALGCAPESLQVLRRFANEDGGEAARQNSGAIAYMPHAAGLRRAIVDLVFAVADEKPMLFSVEDVHWLDGASWEVLVDLITRVAQSRVCLLMTSRLPHARQSAPERVPHELVIRELLPLSMASSLELAHAIGADLSAHIDEELGEWFAHTSEGVPLFLRSLVNHWIETGDAGGIPPTLLGVIGQRLQSLSSDALYVLQTVSLLARHANLGMIESVLEMPYFRIVTAIDDLHKAGAFDSDDDGVLVCHELIGRLAVDRLGKNARRALHRRIAGVLEASDPEELHSPVTCLDRLSHFRESGDRDSYIRAAIQACRQLIESGFSFDSLAAADEALTHCDGAARPQLLTLQARALYECGEYARLLAHSLSPLSVKHGLKDANEIDPEIFIRWLDSAAQADGGARVTELGGAATALAESPKCSSSARIMAATIAIRIASNACDADLAERAYRAGLNATSGLESPGLKKTELDMLYHTTFGEWSIALDAAESLLDSSRRLSNTRERLSRQMHVAFCFGLGGETKRSIELLEAVHRSAIEENLISSLYLAAYRLTYLHLDTCDFELAEKWWREFERYAPLDREPLAATLYHITGCRISLGRGRIELARTHFLRASQSMREDGHVTRHGAALANRLAIGLAEDDIEDLRATVDAAAPVLEKTKRFVFQSFLATQIALALQRLGDSESALSLLSDFARKHRRELTPLPVYLATTLTALRSDQKTSHVR